MFNSVLEGKFCFVAQVGCNQGRDLVFNINGKRKSIMNYKVFQSGGYHDSLTKNCGLEQVVLCRELIIHEQVK